MIRFVVYGLPGPQGSKKLVGRQMVESSKKIKPWREAVKAAALEAYGGDPLDCPIRLALTFTLPKPASAPKTRTTYPMRMPDGSKLQRSTEDAITDAGIWRDDARVVEWIGSKRYPNEGPDALDRPGCVIEITPIT